jgi:hypothetical protein
LLLINTITIYFNKDNLDNLTTDDAFNIATKLMEIIVKISDFSEKAIASEGLSHDQLSQIKLLSFELANRFLTSKRSLTILQSGHCFISFYPSALTKILSHHIKSTGHEFFQKSLE